MNTCNFHRFGLDSQFSEEFERLIWLITLVMDLGKGEARADRAGVFLQSNAQPSLSPRERILRSLG